MYQRLSAVLFPIMSLLFIGSIYWGYQEHQEKNSILIKAENQYQRAFHDLSYHVDQLHQQLGNTLAVNSTSQAYHRKGLVNVWRLTSEAQNEINQLPLTLLPFNETEDFLSHIANFAYKTAVRDLTKEPLSPDEFKMMKTLYAKSEEIASDLQKMQTDVLQNNMRWMDVEVAIASEKSSGDNSVVDGLKTVDNKVSQYPEINWGPSVSSMYEKRSVKMLGGQMVTAQDVQKRAADFLKVNSNNIRVVENGKGTEYASYSALVNESSSGRNIQMDFTQRGGEMIWFINPRNLGQAKISFKQAQLNADRFLNEHGYKGMRAVSYDPNGDSGTFTYVGTQNGVLIYPDKLSVKIALDNGEPIGLQASDYVYEHHKRKLPETMMTSAEARKALNPDMRITSEQKALIKSDMGEEVVTYEYTGKVNGGLYRIYINAQTGLEEAIEQMTTDDKKAASDK
ncbi:germination protein YpeB [Paenibacillus sp. GCM10023252]|uniref:germination protein YpeB n=1 Tax=Paenibacillus sp. GCM10023252 TaxID=3252649 RepID=UPI00361B9BC4